MSKISRRNFIKGIAVLSGGLIFGGAHFVYKKLASSRAEAVAEVTPEAFLPLVTKSEATEVPTSTPTTTTTPPETATPTPSETSIPERPKVVHVMSAAATDWDFGDDWYGDHVNQEVVDEMTDVGLMQLTNTSGRAEAWQTLLPNYQSGQRIAIKVNLNNCLEDGCQSNAIDALIEPVNAIIRGLVERGVSASDIWVYDVTHAWHDGRIPPSLIAGCNYPDVNFTAYVLSLIHI